MSLSPLPATHPVLSSIASARSALGDTAVLPVTLLSAQEKRTALLELTATLAQVEALRLRVLVAGQVLGDVAEADGARDAAAWLAHHARLDPARARYLARLGVALEERYAAVAAALREGHLDLAQADVIVRALDDLPDDLDKTDPGLRARAEHRLVAQADTFGPKGLRVLAARSSRSSPPTSPTPERRKPSTTRTPEPEPSPTYAPAAAATAPPTCAGGSATPWPPAS